MKIIVCLAVVCIVVSSLLWGSSAKKEPAITDKVSDSGSGALPLVVGGLQFVSSPYFVSDLLRVNIAGFRCSLTLPLVVRLKVVLR